jgi:hypothetical protein
LLALPYVKCFARPSTGDQVARQSRFVLPGDSPNQALPAGNGVDQGDETHGGGTVAGPDRLMPDPNR